MYTEICILHSLVLCKCLLYISKWSEKTSEETVSDDPLPEK